MRRIEINMDLADADPNSVFENQTLGAAGSFSLNGVEVVNGEWVTPDGCPRKIGFQSSGNLSARTLTISGFADKNKTIPLVKTISGPNNNTVKTTDYFYSIQSILSDGAIGTNIQAGTVNEASSIIIPIKRSFSDRQERNAGLTFIATGTINYTLQQTNDDIQSLTDRNFNWVNNDDTDLVNATTSQNANYFAIPNAVRVLINSYSSGAELLIQVN